MAEIKPLRLIRINSVPRTITSKFRWRGPDPFPAITKKWHGGQGQAAKAVVKKAYITVDWITFVSSGSFSCHRWIKRWHNWVNLMAVITYRLYCFHPEKTRVLKESEKILKGSEVHCFNLLFTKSLFLKETVAFRLLNKKLKQLIDKSQS